MRTRKTKEELIKEWKAKGFSEAAIASALASPLLKAVFGV